MFTVFEVIQKEMVLLPLFFFDNVHLNFTLFFMSFSPVTCI